MNILKNTFLNTSYSVRLRLIAFVTVAVLLVVSISFTAIMGLNTTHHSLSNLRDKTLNQMFFSMTLGVKTTQISTYATQLSQTVRALEYKESSEQLVHHIQQVHNLLNEVKENTTPEERLAFADIVQFIELLEKSVQELLLQAHQRHIINTTIISKLNQSLLYLEHIKRLEKRTALSQSSQPFTSRFNQIENLIEDATKGAFSPASFSAIQSTFSFLSIPQDADIQAEWKKIEQEFKQIIDYSYQLTGVNLRIQFLTYQIDFLVKKIDTRYTQLAQDKVAMVNSESEQIQTRLSEKTTSIFIFSLFTIILILILGSYIYRLFGKRLYSITQALTKLSQGDKNANVPQQQRQDEIGDLARAFHIFQQNVLKLDQADALLKEKSALLEQTFLAMRDGLAIFDREHKLVSCNSRFAQLLQQTDNQYLTWKIGNLVAFLDKNQAKVYGTNQPLNESLLTEIRTEQEPLEIEYAHLILEWRISSLNNGGLVAFLIDRTQRKKLETDLAHSQKMRSIGHLTGGIAHDFNNFLAVIIGNLDLIEPDSLNEKQAKRLQRALKAAENSATLTQRLLAYARKQPLHPVALDINQLLLDFTDLMKHSLPPSIKVRLDLGENLPYVYIDKNQLETALVNLLVNAKDALQGEGTIVIRTRQKLVQRTYQQEQMLQLSIIDDGCGMDEATQKRIFEPFFTTKQKGKGSGLGLSMVYGFIRQSKGRVVVESQPQVGTTIHLQLPLAIKTPQKSTALYTTENPINTAFTLLLVEDKADLRETLSEQLKDMGYTVIAVESGERATDYFQSGHTVDYLLSDIVLAGKMDGIDVAKYVKTHSPHTKILLMTGNFAENAEKLGKFPVLNKPFKLAELEHALRQL